MKSFLAFLIAVFCSVVHGAYIPPQAFTYSDTIKQELDKRFSELPKYEYVPALIEHESCISLTHRRCWNPKSRLKTSREEGAGLGQLTRAYNPNGSLRFDKLSELRGKYKRDLSELSWGDVYSRPDLQIRSIVLMLREDYGKLYDVPDSMNRLAMVDNAYNGGMGGLQKERRACSLTKGCNPNVWFGHVEKHCLKSKKALYSGRSVCEISRHHTSDVLKARLPKYIDARYFR